MTPQPLYVADPDGTLLDGEGHLSDLSYDLVRELLAEGLPLTVASARSVTLILHKLRDLFLPLPVIEFNSAFTTDLHSGEHLSACAIDRTPAEALFAEITTGNFHPSLVSTFDGTEDHLYCEQPPGASVGISRTSAREVTGEYGMLTTRTVGSTIKPSASPLWEQVTDWRSSSDAWGPELQINLFENRYSSG